MKLCAWVAASVGVVVFVGGAPAPADDALGPFDLLIHLVGTPQDDGQILLRVQDYDLIQQEELLTVMRGEPASAIMTKIEIVLQELLAIHERHLVFQGPQLVIQEFFSKEFYAQSVLVLRALVPGLTITMRARSRDTAFLTTAFFTDSALAPGEAEMDVLASPQRLPGHFEYVIAEGTSGEALWEPLAAQMRAVGWVAVTVPTWGVVVTNLTLEDEIQARLDAPGIGVGLYRLDPEAVLYPFGCDTCNRQGGGGG